MSCCLCKKNNTVIFINDNGYCIECIETIKTQKKEDLKLGNKEIIS